MTNLNLFKDTDSKSRGGKAQREFVRAGVPEVIEDKLRPDLPFKANNILIMERVWLPLLTESILWI